MISKKEEVLLQLFSMLKVKVGPVDIYRFIKSEITTNPEELKDLIETYKDRFTEKEMSLLMAGYNSYKKIANTVPKEFHEMVNYHSCGAYIDFPIVGLWGRDLAEEWLNNKSVMSILHSAEKNELKEKKLTYEQIVLKKAFRGVKMNDKESYGVEETNKVVKLKSLVKKYTEETIYQAFINEDFEDLMHEANIKGSDDHFTGEEITMLEKFLEIYKREKSVIPTFDDVDKVINELSGIHIYKEKIDYLVSINLNIRAIKYYKYILNNYGFSLYVAQLNTKVLDDYYNIKKKDNTEIDQEMEVEYAKRVVKDFLTTDYISEAVYCRINEFERASFKHYVELVKENDQIVYKQYLQRKLERDLLDFKNDIELAHLIAYFLEHGIEHGNHGTRPFDMIDFNCSQLGNYDDYYNKVKDYLTDKEKKLFAKHRYRFLKDTSLDVTKLKNGKYRYDAQYNAKGHHILGTGRVITPEEIDEIVAFLKKSRKKINIGEFEAAIERWRDGDLELSTEYYKGLTRHKKNIDV